MKNYRHWTLAAIVAIFGIIIGFTACDNGSNPVCKCPNGTIHFIGDTLICNSENSCFCEHGNFTGKRVEGIPVTNRGVSDADFDTTAASFGTAFNHHLISDTQRAWLKINLKEVKVVPTGGANGILNGILTIEKGGSSAAMRDEFLFWLGEQIPPITKLMDQFDNSINTARLAFGQIIAKRMI
jgi:hypothetical protein